MVSREIALYFRGIKGWNTAKAFLQKVFLRTIPSRSFSKGRSFANQKNREALAETAKQGDVYALLVTAPDGA